MSWRSGSICYGEDVVVALLSSFLVVALAEMGDKTQLVAFSQASRYGHPWLVMLGILIATVVIHGAASWLGMWAGQRCQCHLRNG